MCKSSRGDSDRPVVSDASKDVVSQSMVDMSDPLEVKSLYLHGENKKASMKIPTSLNFDNPYGESESQIWQTSEQSSNT